MDVFCILLLLLAKTDSFSRWFFFWGGGGGKPVVFLFGFVGLVFLLIFFFGEVVRKKFPTLK